MPNTFLEPTWTQPPELGDARKSVFELRQISPFELTGVLVRLLQYYFADADRIKNENLKSLTWTENSRTSNIQIVPSFTIDRSQNFKLPLLSVTRGPITPVSIPSPLQNLPVQVFLSGGGMPTRELTSSTSYVRFIQGSHKVLCVATSGAEAEALCEEIFNRFLMFAPAIKSDFGLDNLDIATVAETQKVEENFPIRGYVATIDFKWQRQQGWQVINEEPV